MAQVSLLLTDSDRQESGEPCGSPFLFRPVENGLLMNRNPFQEIVGIGDIDQVERRAIRRYLNVEGKSAPRSASKTRRPAAIGRDRGDRESVARRGDIPATHRVRFVCCGPHAGGVQGKVDLASSHAASTLSVKGYLPRTGQVSLVDGARR